MCHGSSEVPLSMPGPPEALYSEAAFPGRGEGCKEGKQGLGVLPQVLLGPVAMSPWAVGREEKLAAGTRPACTLSQTT